MFSEYTSLPYGFLKEIASQKQYWMFDGIINTITEGIRQEIITEKYQWKEIWYKHKLEGNKIRKIGIQDIKQQLYDYIAVNGLMELFNKKDWLLPMCRSTWKGSGIWQKSDRKMAA